jgi:hypothetical protein
MVDNAPLRDKPGTFLRMGYILALRDQGLQFDEIGGRLGISKSRAAIIHYRALVLRRATPSMRTTETSS